MNGPRDPRDPRGPRVLTRGLPPPPTAGGRPPGYPLLDDLADPIRMYSSGASEAYAAGVDHKAVLRWCVPPYYIDGCLGAPTVAVTARVKLDDPDTDASTVDLSDVFASITWGSGINDGPDRHDMNFDVVGGGSVTVEAWSLTVYITYPGVPSAAHPKIRVDVSVGLGTSGKQGVSSSATRTVKIATNLLAGAGSAIFPIPLYATGARIVNTDPAIPLLQIDQFEANGGQIVSSERVGKLQASAIPVARGLGARYFQVVNFTGADSHNVAVIFDLQPN